MQSIPPLRFDAAGRRDGRGLGVVWGRHYLSKLLVGLRAVLARPRLDAQIGFQFWFLGNEPHPLCGAVRACRAPTRTATGATTRRTSTGSSGSTTASPSARTSARRRSERLFRRRSAAEFLWLRHVQPASPSLIPARRHTHISTTYFGGYYYGLVQRQAI